MMALPELPDARVKFDPDFVDATRASEWQRELIDTLPWETHVVKIFGKAHASPRLSSWHGDAHCAYRYSGHRYQPKPWTPILQVILDQLHAYRSERYNCVLANFYRSGADSMGWHSDDEPELGQLPSIASLSLGAARRFCLRHKVRKQQAEVRLTHGSLLLMQGTTQTYWQHALPKMAGVGSPRLNLTFRWIAI